ncbi:hypothetical protein [Acanthopleuribacter pedis]|uniref:Uncharacterized protein n=1 Tax=Acanthopleuribacter pedis TaxID=442870 RepID=A0A8J7U7G7_9BACT|nr:hypothetical protein [Acanthopleuribacter pedis]MBO1322498.1 hypothetical protein [Acanthopleuribacter pedis]
MNTLLIIYLIAFFKGPETILVSQGQPVIPEIGQVEDRTVVLHREPVECRITHLTADELRDYLAGMGAAKAVQEHQLIARKLEQSISFMISLENRGMDRLLFNPDQIELLSGKRRPVGTKLGMLDLWPSALPGRAVEQERFARLFIRGTTEIPPGGKAFQLLVFRPMAGQTWPKQITLSIPRLYHGVDLLNFACRYDLKRERAKK